MESESISNNKAKVYHWDLALRRRSSRGQRSCFVKLPILDLKREFGQANLVPVRVVFDNKVEYRGTIGKYNGLLSVIVLLSVQKQLNKSVGDIVHVQLQYDSQPRIRNEVIPPALRTIIVDHQLLDVWNLIGNTVKHNYVRKYLHTKHEDTRQYLVEVIIAYLNKRKISLRG